mgnify:FL=1
MTKQKKLRHLEYYDLQDTFDKLYADSKNNKIFTKLMQIIASEEVYTNLINMHCRWKAV